MGLIILLLVVFIAAIAVTVVVYAAVGWGVVVSAIFLGATRLMTKMLGQRTGRGANRILNFVVWVAQQGECRF